MTLQRHTLLMLATLVLICVMLGGAVAQAQNNARLCAVALAECANPAQISVLR